MIILASQSPRRRDLLQSVGVPFRVASPAIDETPLPGEKPAALVERLAGAKARAVPAGSDDVVLAADTVVVLDGEILGKPRDLGEAGAMIARLAGRTHQVYTGVCLLTNGTADVWHCVSRVTFKALSPGDIDAYLQMASPLDKAGAYAIQEHEEFLVERVQGSYTNVIGLPIEEILPRLPPACRPQSEKPAGRA